MNRMTEISAESTANRWPIMFAAWVAIAATILVALRADVAHMVGLWWNTDTFGHCLLIPRHEAPLISGLPPATLAELGDRLADQVSAAPHFVPGFADLSTDEAAQFGEYGFLLAQQLGISLRRASGAACQPRTPRQPGQDHRGQDCPADRGRPGRQFGDDVQDGQCRRRSQAQQQVDRHVRFPIVSSEGCAGCIGARACDL